MIPVVLAPKSSAVSLSLQPLVVPAVVTTGNLFFAFLVGYLCPGEVGWRSIANAGRGNCERDEGLRMHFGGGSGGATEMPDSGWLLLSNGL